MHVARRILFSLAALLAALALCGPASGGGKTVVQLTQVLATEPGSGPKRFEPSVKEFRSQLEKYNYQSFRNVGQERKDVDDGTEASFPLYESGFTVRATPSDAGGSVALDLKLTDAKGKEVLSTRLKVKSGGTSIVGKELESKAGYLFLAFTVKRG